MARYTSVTHFTPKCTVTKRRGTVFIHQFQLMTLETFQAVKFKGSKGVPGASAASWGGSGVPGVGGRQWQRGRAEGEWGGAGRQLRPYSYHRQSFESATYKTGGGYWTRSDEFCEYPLLEKLHFHVALEEVRVTELLSY